MNRQKKIADKLLLPASQEIEVDKTKKQLIIGAGLSGLVTIIEFMKYAQAHPSERFELHVIEKRDLNFTRRQKLINDDDEKMGDEFPHPFLDWESYCQNLYNDNLYDRVTRCGNAVALQNLKKFLKKLSNQSRRKHPLTGRTIYKNFSIKSLQFALLDQIKLLESQTSKAKIVWHTHSVLHDIDFHNNKCSVKCQDKIKEIEFDNILNCEGANGVTTKLINRYLPAEVKEKFEFVSFGFPTLKHCAVRLKLNLPNSNKNIPFFNYVVKPAINRAALKRCRELGYTRRGVPSIFIVDDIYKQNNDGSSELRLFIASEIPDSIYDNPNQQEKRDAMIEWCKQIAAFQFQIPPDLFVFDEKGEDENHHLNALAFINELKYATKPVMILPNGGKIFLIGDAAISNFYPAGFSSLYALNQACLAVKLLCNNENVDDYQKMCQYHQKYLLDVVGGLDTYLHRNFHQEYLDQQQVLTSGRLTA